MAALDSGQEQEVTMTNGEILCFVLGLATASLIDFLVKGNWPFAVAQFALCLLGVVVLMRYRDNAR